jgi:hypothetical protein
MTLLEEKIQNLLDADEGAHRFGLHVVEELTRTEDNWTYVIVQPTLPGIRAYDYAELLERVEQQIRKQESANVLVLPASGDLN